MSTKTELKKSVQDLLNRQKELRDILDTEYFDINHDWTDSGYCMDAMTELYIVEHSLLPKAQKALAEFDKEKLEAANNRKEQLELLLDKAYYNAPIDGDPNWERCTELFAELYTLEHETIPKLTKRIQDKEQDDE